jgi:hypothetical protein
MTRRSTDGEKAIPRWAVVGGLLGLVGTSLLLVAQWRSRYWSWVPLELGFPAAGAAIGGGVGAVAGVIYHLRLARASSKRRRGQP